MVWVVDEEKIFSINKKIEIQLKKVGNEKIIIIDNFYKDPDAVRHLILNSPATTWKSVLRGFPGARNYLCLDTTNLTEVCSDIAEKVFNTQLFDLNFFTSNIFIQTGKPVGKSGIPHTDPQYLSGLIYLNTPEECRGGTAFYKHKPTNSQYKTENHLYESGNKYIDFLAESNEYWDLLEVIPMRYNRFLLYRGNIFHSGYIRRDWFTDYYRINQIFFFSIFLINSTILNLEKFPLIKEVTDDSGKKFTHIQVADNPELIFADFNPKILTDFLSLIDGQRTFGQIFTVISANHNLSFSDIAIIKKVLRDLISREKLFLCNS